MKETSWKTLSGNAKQSKEWQPLRSSQEARLKSRTIRKDLPVGRIHTHTQTLRIRDSGLLHSFLKI